MKIIDHSPAWIVLATFACLSLPLARGQAETVQWNQQLGTGSHEDAIGVSADGLGNVFIAGETNGTLGAANAGGSDAFLSMFDASGNLVWKTSRGVGTSRQIGTSAADHGYGVSADGLGSVYMTGITAGNLAGTNAGGNDAFITKWDSSGALLWTRQLGTPADDFSYGVSADKSGDVYMSGYTLGSLDGVHAGGAFISKYDAAGALQWTRQSSLSGSASYGVSTDGVGNVYIAGDSAGGAFVSKYDATGALLYTEQLTARGFVDCRGVAADGLGNVYITGSADNSLTGINGTGNKTFVSKYDAVGTLLWTRQIESNSNDDSLGVSTDGLGNVYITGGTNGNLDGPGLGIEDAFVAKYDAAGNLFWIKQLGTSSYERSLAVSADRLGNVYTAGGTEGSLGRNNAGFGDAFVVKINDVAVPEPTTGVLFVLAGLSISCRRIRVGIY